MAKPAPMSETITAKPKTPAMVPASVPRLRITPKPTIRFDGPPALVRAFPTWLGLTRFAKYALPAGLAQPSGAASALRRVTRSASTP